MSTLLPLQTALPSWLETGANPLIFTAAVEQLQYGLKILPDLDAQTPEALTVAQLKATFAPGQPSPLSRENLRQLLLGVARRPEGARVLVAAMTRARTEWILSAQRRRFAKDPAAYLARVMKDHESLRAVRAQLDSFGNLKIDGKVRATFAQHAREGVLVRMLGDIVLGIDFLKDGIPPQPKPQVEFKLIYQNGKLVDSFHGKINLSRWKELGRVTLKTYLTKQGWFFGMRPRHHFAQYGGYPVEVEIQDGVVMGIRALKPAACLHLASEPVP